MSPTNRFPTGSIAMPKGLLNLASVPVPSEKPDVLLPAKVVTTPEGVTLRISLLFESTAKIFPAESTAKLLAAEKLAEVPMPSSWPRGPPARVLTCAVPEGGTHAPLLLLLEFELLLLLEELELLLDANNLHALSDTVQTRMAKKFRARRPS
jgi:hypothetical protein